MENRRFTNLLVFSLLILVLIATRGCTYTQSFSQFSLSKIGQDLGNDSSDDQNPENSKDKATQPWESKAINTGENANYLTDLEKNILIEMNMVRTNPKRYAEMYLTELKSYYKGKEILFPDNYCKLTTEGVKAVDECYDYLVSKRPMGVLEPLEQLCRAARDHAIDQGETGDIGHVGSDSSTISDRINRYGKHLIAVGENICYGHNLARRIVLILLVNDGVPSRGHRENTMFDRFKYVGIAFGSHPEYKYVCVIDFVGGFE